LAASLGTAAVVYGWYSVVQGNYELAMQQFLVGLSLLSGTRNASQFWSRRAAYSSAGALQDELLASTIGESRYLKSNITISVGVGTTAEGETVTLVSVNGGAPKKMVETLRALQGDRFVLVEGGEHAEQNVIREAQKMGLQEVRVGATNYHCESCQAAGSKSGAVLTDPNKGFRLTKPKSGPAPTVIDPSAADYLSRHPDFPSLLY
jgi:hypothetical protein